MVMAIASVCPIGAGAEDLATLVVEAGPHDRTETPVVVPASPREVFKRDMSVDALLNMRLELVESGEQGDTRSIPAQWQVATEPPMVAHGAGALTFVLPGKTPAGSVRRFRLRVAAAATTPLAIDDDKGKSLLLKHGAHPVARYNYGLVQKQPGKPDLQDRTAYFHPIWAPGGQIVTDDFPKSHAHQRGLFFAWTRATIGNYRADFWNLGDGRGKTVHSRLDCIAVGPVFAGFVAHNEMIAEQRTVIKETWVTRLYALPAGPWGDRCGGAAYRHGAPRRARQVPLRRFGVSWPTGLVRG